MPVPRRHVEHFGPDFSRGPFSSSDPEVAAVQIASAIAQLRAPVLRSDSEIQAHAEFVRDLADRLFPDHASQIRFDIGDESSDSILTYIHENSGGHALLHCWLADSAGGGETATAPDSVTWGGGAVVLETITANKRYLVLTPTAGVITATVSYTGAASWRIGVSRNGRVYYSTALTFSV